MFQDVRYAVRVLLQGKTWTVMVLVSLALGIGANTALFGATSGLLLRTLPVEDPGSLVRLLHVGRNRMATDVNEYGNVSSPAGAEVGSTFSYPLVQALVRANQTLEGIAAGAPMGTLNVVVDGQAEVASAYLATGNYHQLLGVRALRGRTLVPDDDRADAAPVATISEPFWGRRFGKDPAIAGRVVHVNDIAVTIVGVTPASSTGVQRALDDPPDLVLPLSLDRQLTLPVPSYPGGPEQARLDRPTAWWLQVFGRVKPGVTPAHVQGNLGGVFQAAAREGMASELAALPEELRNTTSNRDRAEVPRLSVSSMARGIYDHDAATLRGVAIIGAVVGLILLLVCANVANLLLSRAAARQKEYAVRLTMGATRARLVRQMLTESVLLALAGGALGLLVASWGRELLPGPAGRAPLDWRVLLFTSGVAVATGMLFGLAPALRVARTSPAETMKQTGRAVVGARRLLPESLLVVQVAISVVLLVGAGLFLRTADNLRRVDVGFDPANLVLFRVDPRLNRYDAARSASLYRDIIQRVGATPGVQSVTLTNPPLLTGWTRTTSIVVHGRPYAPGVGEGRASSANTIHALSVAPGFFETVGIPLLRGRGFSEHDNTPAARVAIINQAAANQFFPGEDPIGKRFGRSPEASDQIEVVGVVRDAKYTGLRELPPPTLYEPYGQAPVGAMTVVARTSADPATVMPAIREAVRQVDPTLPLLNMSTQTDQIEQRFAQEQVFARAYTMFGALALLVAAIGIFGLMSYNVARRTTEIGVRMALGAGQRTVLRMILRESLVLVAVGVAIGIAAALGTGRFVSSLLYGIEPTDVPTAALAVTVMVSVATLAGYLPARRASRVAPMQALRHD